MNLESTVDMRVKDALSGISNPKTLEHMVEEFAKNVKYKLSSQDKLRKIYDIQLSETKWQELLNDAVEFQYKSKAPKNFRTFNEDGSCNITTKQREIIENSIVSERHKFKEALLEGIFENVFKNIKGENDGDFSGYSISLKNKEDDSIQYTMEFDEIQNLQEIDFSEIHIEKYEGKISDEDVNNEIQLILKSQPQIVKSEDQSATATHESVVNIDFKGFISGKSFKNGEAKDYIIDLAAKKMLPDFESGIVGMKVGEIKDVQVKFPKNYNVKAFAGMNVKFTIKLNFLMENKTFERVEDFIEKSEFSNVEQLKEIITNEINFNMETLLWAIQRHHVVQKMNDTIEVELPGLIIKQQFENEQRAYIESRKHDMQRIITDSLNSESLKTEIEKDLKEMEEAIRMRVKLSIILTDTAKKHNLELSQESKNEECIRQARMNKISLDKFIEKLKADSNGELSNRVVGNAFERMIIEFVITKSKSDIIQLSFDEIKKRYKETFVDSGKKWGL